MGGVTVLFADAGEGAMNSGTPRRVRICGQPSHGRKPVIMFFRQSHRLVVVAALVAVVTGCGGGAYQQRVETGNAAANSVDIHIADRVRHALASDERIASGSLTVTVREGVVYLSGSPRDSAARQLAVVTARHVPGVRSVIDNMGFY